MLVKLIAGANRNWGAPREWNVKKHGVCGGLPTADVDGGNGVLYRVSAWEPTPEELEKLNKGACIHLYVNALVHPVVAMEVGAVPTDEGE